MGDTTDTGDDASMTSLDTIDPSDDTNADSGNADSGDGDSGQGDVGAGDGDGDGEAPSSCGDGVISGDEECDTAMAIPLPCGNNQVGSYLCNADCTKNETFCDCEVGTEGCLCDQGEVCEIGTECINDGLPVCEAVCLVATAPCGPLDVCCEGTCQVGADSNGVAYCL